MNEWHPKPTAEVQCSWKRKFVTSLASGARAGVAALPLAMGFAIASGTPIQGGLYCALLVGFLTCILGGSAAEVSGATGAIVVVAYGVTMKYGVDSFFLCSFMAGAVLVIFRVTGLGTAVKLIPKAIVIGFSNGISVILASMQMKDFWGLKIRETPMGSWRRLELIIKNLSTFSLLEASVAVIAMGAILLSMRYAKRMFAYVVALCVGISLVALLRLPVETIGGRFANIPSAFLLSQVPQFHPDLLSALLLPAIALAMLGSVESLKYAAASGQTATGEDELQPRSSVRALTNMFPLSSRGSRTAGDIAWNGINVHLVRKAPFVDIVPFLTLLACFLFVASLIRFVPLSVLAAILLIQSVHIGGWREIPAVLKLSPTETSSWLLTFLLTVFADITIAVVSGTIMAALIFIRKTTATTGPASLGAEEYVRKNRQSIFQRRRVPTYVSVLKIQGSFLAGTTDKTDQLIAHLSGSRVVVILRLRSITLLDELAVQALRKAADTIRASGRELILCEAREQPERLLLITQFEKHVGIENICASFSEALERAELLHAQLAARAPAGSPWGGRNDVATEQQKELPGHPEGDER